MSVCTSAISVTTRWRSEIKKKCLMSSGKRRVHSVSGRNHADRWRNAFDVFRKAYIAFYYFRYDPSTHENCRSEYQYRTKCFKVHYTPFILSQILATSIYCLFQMLNNVSFRCRLISKYGLKLLCNFGDRPCTIFDFNTVLHMIKLTSPPVISGSAPVLVNWKCVVSFNQFSLYLRTLRLVWRMMRRPITRRLTRIQTMWNVPICRKLL